MEEVISVKFDASQEVVSVKFNTDLALQLDPGSPSPLSTGSQSFSASPSENMRWFKSRQTTINYFPVYALPVSDFQQLTTMRPHEEALRLEQLLIPDVDIIMHFISHEWLSFSHPDPDCVQLQLMQRIFIEFMEGRARSFFSDSHWESFQKGVSTSTSERLRTMESSFADRLTSEETMIPDHVADGCVWLDYHSIPQDLRNTEAFDSAVQSIPHYVERTDYFWICAPRATHKDLQVERNFYTWRQRGWCRMEEVTNLFSKTSKLPLVVTNSENIASAGFMDLMAYLLGHPARSVARGGFSCCRIGHERRLPDGTLQKISCDKEALAPVLSSLLQSFYDNNSGESQSFKSLVCLSITEDVLDGMDLKLPYYLLDKRKAITTDDFLEAFDFDSLQDLDEAGFTPLMWAIFGANFETVKTILESDPDALYVRSDHNASAIQYAVHKPPHQFKELLSYIPADKAAEELSNVSLSGYTAVDRAARLGFHENLRSLLEMTANPHAVRKDNGCTPLLSACVQGYPLCCQALLDFSADVHSVTHLGQTGLHLAAEQLTMVGNPDLNARLEVLRLLLKADADPSRLDSSGCTALQVAQRSGFTEALPLLLNSSSI